VSEKQSVTVAILGHEYRIRTDAEPKALEQVASLVAETMERIRRRTGTVDSLDVAVMAALNLAHEVQASRRAADDAAEAAPDSPRMRALIEDVEAVLVETAG
jgi:cell division protein ZapA